jgi:hypothetical protein
MTNVEATTSDRLTDKQSPQPFLHIPDDEVASARQLDALKRRVTPEILGTWPATARVRAATYANLSGLDVAVGFYM